MAYYTIGDVAERCGINPVTLRAWQRRYGLLKPQRSEGGHRQFDDADIQRIEEIKYWMSKGVSVGKVKALLERNHVPEEQLWLTLQEEMMLLVRKVNPTKLREKIISLSREHSADLLIDNLLLPVRQKLSQDESTALLMRSLLDGVLIRHCAQSLAEVQSQSGEEILLIGWQTDDRAALWLEAWRLSRRGLSVNVFAEPVETLRPELFPGQHIFLWTGKALLAAQQEQILHWKQWGYDIELHQ
ncbi:MerR family transcriptional regulator [Enterobacter sp. Ap-1006]|uniref:MerR family transcriptional regulator n=1 Tax=Enterobacter sp. Ap-1006 TaxID=2608345 RepID=UPI00141FE35E|nr:MerR family transcriptional regulator [Enterobacter sp. Ap-1006]NIF47816.1 MerR family transcriptional regulator [Enterobacter sp. Ap-1006]